MSVAPQELADNPELLLHSSRPPDYPLNSPHHGRVGAVLQKGNFFIMSPYPQESIPCPPFDSVVQLRADWRFGPDDPTSWPQVFMTAFRHYCVIKAKPSDPFDPDNIWWKPLEEPDFHPGPRGSGEISSLFLRPYHDPYEDLQRRVRAYLNATDRKEVPRDVYTLVIQLDSSFSRLRELAYTWYVAGRTVSKFQRVYLELLALMDWTEIYLPVLESRIPLPPSRENPSIIGTYLSGYDTEWVERFYAARIPFWIIWPTNQLFLKRIDSVAPLLHPENVVCMQLTPHSRPLFKGGFGRPEKFLAIIRYFNTLISCENPFMHEDSATRLSRIASSSAPASASSAPTSSSATSSAGKAQASSSKRPYRQDNKPYARKQPSSMKLPILVIESKMFTNFEEPSHPLFPVAPGAWSDSLKKVEMRQKRDLQGFVFPDPKLFVGGGQSREKAQRCVIQYLRWRSFLLSRLLGHGSTSKTLSNALWRTFLSLGLGKGDEKTGASVLNERKQIRSRLSIPEDMEEECLDSRWGGVEVSMRHPPSDSLIREILWELGELNFRFDLVELHRVSVHEDDLLESSYHTVDRCFPGADILDIQVVSQGNEGLASTMVPTRESYLLALCQIMSFWKGGEAFRPFRKKVLKDYEPGALMRWEKKVAEFYTQSHFDVFARSPSLPRRLH